MTTFNDLLRDAGLDPNDVILIRHGGTGATGLKPYDLWVEGGDDFDRYQSTQEAMRRIFRNAIYWASFVSGPENTTIFCGLYEASLGDVGEVDWICRLSGMKPGQDKNKPYDFYRLKKRDELSHYVSKPLITWSKSGRPWIQYAHKNDKIIDDIWIHSAPAVPHPKSAEGRKLWTIQQRTERSNTIGRMAKLKNAELNGGQLSCDACLFSHSDPSMFDAHHVDPLMTGERVSSVDDLLILCPTCHRRAHQSENRLIPFSLFELQAWIASGRP